MWYEFESFSALTAGIYPEFYHPNINPSVYRKKRAFFPLPWCLKKDLAFEFRTDSV
jgi:hypothetical protein